MEKLKKIDWKVLQEYVDNKLIIINKHPEYDIWILNYSKEAQFTKTWDLITSSCRGLVIDINGNIISRCISKFFNIEELKPEEIPNEQFDIFEKIDGSYITMFFYNNEWIFASRGSFTSEQAISAKKIFNNKYKNNVSLDINYNYIMELIGENNRIVLYYPENDLILLTCFLIKEGNELSIYNENFNGFNKVKKYDIKNISNLNKLKELEEDNKEGFVVKFKNDFRIKIKFEEYVRLHRIVTNVSNLTVWEHLMNNYNFDALYDRVPDEFFSWLKRTISSLQSEYNEIERQALKEFTKIYHVNEITNRKDFAMEAVKTEYQSILFRMYDKRRYDEIIWKLVRPVYSKPFRDGFEYSI